MPCIKCNNGKWKYGKHGNCQFDTLKACQDAAAVIHIPPSERLPRNKEICNNCASEMSLLETYFLANNNRIKP